MHEYISDSRFPYGECIDCRKRSAHVCIRCQYCYSCHPKIEQLEKSTRVKKHAHVGYQMPNQLFIKYKKSGQPQ
jgi:hypothetical protein